VVFALVLLARLTEEADDRLVGDSEAADDVTTTEPCTWARCVRVCVDTTSSAPGAEPDVLGTLLGRGSSIFLARCSTLEGSKACLANCCDTLPAQ